MNYQKYILELGTGVDLHGGDETKAASKAVKDAVSHSSMVGIGSLFKLKNFKQMSDALMVDVTIATPNPEKVDREAVLKTLPEGNRRINVIKGGMQWPDPSTNSDSRSHGIVMTNAVIMVLIDVDKLERK